MTGELGTTFGGYRVIENALLTKRKQYRFPKCKRKRIRKKFAKNESNYRNTPDTAFYFMKNQGCFVCHPIMADKLRKSLPPRTK